MSDKLITTRPNGRKRVQTVNNEPSRTQQQYKDECDVNNIMAQYKKTGSITHLRNQAEGVYMDLTTVPTDYAAALAVVNNANEAFEAMPAKVREKLKHNPAELISWLKNPANKKEAHELGLIELKDVPQTPPLEPGKDTRPPLPQT